MCIDRRKPSRSAYLAAEVAGLPNGNDVMAADPLRSR
jgi:hypothetical protein